MTEQMDLWTKYRRTDPETSREAVRSVRSFTAGQARIFGVLRRFGPLTDEEIFERLKFDGGGIISPSGARTRRSELVTVGLVRDSRKRVTMRTGRLAIVWEIA